METVAVRPLVDFAVLDRGAVMRCTRCQDTARVPDMDVQRAIVAFQDRHLGCDLLELWTACATTPRPSAGGAPTVADPRRRPGDCRI
jgi:hypothetical protein